MLVTHPTRSEVPALAQAFADGLAEHGIEAAIVPEADPSRDQVRTDSVTARLSLIHI